MADDNGKSGAPELRKCQLTCFKRSALRHGYSKLRDACYYGYGRHRCFDFGLWISRKKSVYWTQINFYLLLDSNIALVLSYRNKSLYVQQQTQIKCQWKYSIFQAEEHKQGSLIQTMFIYFFQFINSFTYSANVQCEDSACQVSETEHGSDFKSFIVYLVTEM